MDSMIRVNMQIKDKSNFKFDYENFPRLYGFDGKTRIVDTSIIFDGDCIDVQTVLSNTNHLQNEVNRWIEKQETILNAQLADIQHKLEILKAVKG